MTTGGAGNVSVVMTMTGSEVATQKMGGFTAAVKANQTAVSELASGALFLGTSFLAMGASLSQSSNEMAKTLGSTMSMIGGVFAFVGSATMFIFSVAKMTESLKQLALWQTITSALSGPAGWAKLAVGVAVAGGAAYGISRLAASGPAQPEGGGGGRGDVNNVTVNVAGSVKTERQLVDAVQEGLAKKGQRNAGRITD
jgi:hypothetical protein